MNIVCCFRQIYIPARKPHISRGNKRLATLSFGEFYKSGGGYIEEKKKMKISAQDETVASKL